MSELTDKEFDAILSLNAEYRQAMFDRVVAEREGLYILADEEGPLILEDTEEDENNNLFSIIPVWSDERLATAWAKESGNESMKAQFITKKAWNESWVPMLKEQKNVLLGIMPVADKDFSVEDLGCI